MPDAPETVTLVGPSGDTVHVPVDQAGTLLSNGYTPETGAQSAARSYDAAREDVYGGVGGKVATFGANALSGLTLGASDVAFDVLGGGDDLQALREVNPGTAAAGQLVGAVGGAFAAPGSLLARTPAGLISRAGMKIAGAGEGAGALARAGYAAAGAGLEGAAQNAGAYISDVALGDRELSADGFMGAMGNGALWGGVAGGALQLAASGASSARRLFPRQEMTREAVQAAEDVARREVSAAVDEGDQLATAARDRLRQIRADRAAVDLETKIKLDDIAVREAEAVAAQRIAKAEAQTERAQIALEKAKSGPSKRTRKALQGEDGAASQPLPDAATTRAPTPEPQPTTVAAGATEDTATALERQLMATKQQIDAGATLQDFNAARAPKLKPTHIEDKLNAEIAKVDPEAARLVKGLDELEAGRDAMGQWLGKYGKGGAVDKFERQQAARAWADNVRPKDAGYYTKLPHDSQRPGFSEGSAAVPRGRQSVWRGSEEERAIADARTMSKVSPEEQMAADDAVAQMWGRKESREIAADIADGKAPIDVPIDEQVSAAVRSRVDDIDDDIAQSADAIGRHEAASAELAEALGPAAPPTAQARGAAFREAQTKAETAVQDAAVKATGDMERAAETIALGGTPAGAGRVSGAFQKAQDVGTAVEAMRALGVDLPDPRNIPVIGPVLSMYLKARLLGKTFGRFGGKIADTAESTIAKKAAATKERVYSAVDSMLEATSTKAARASAKIGGPAAALGHVLFAGPDDDRSTPYTSEAPKGSLGALYLARSEEVIRAMAPGAIEASVRARVKASDPTIVQAIVDAQTRKLQFLDSKMPRSNEPPVPGQTRMPWVPSRAQIAQWSRYVEAAENPVGVIERAAGGGYVSLEAVETLRTVYPKLFAEAQTRILQRVQERPEAVPYHRRVQLSVMFDMPFDGSQTPEGAAFLQQSYQPAPPPAPPQPQMGQPTVTADINTAARTDPMS